MAPATNKAHHMEVTHKEAMEHHNKAMEHLSKAMEHLNKAMGHLNRAMEHLKAMEHKKTLKWPTGRSQLQDDLAVAVVVAAALG